MFKTAIATLAAAAAVAAPSAALAGPYVNVEANSGWTGSDYTGTTTDAHLGYEGTVGAAAWYVQGGVSLVSPDGGETDTVPSGKAGIGAPITEALGAYGEVSFIGSGDDDIDRGYGAKLGLKYNF
jgi:hypothetical protein|tara:strand:+ start:372 stop:746 length:375 start_codon:yes stop_codon:yes gene_type:complete